MACDFKILISICISFIISESPLGHHGHVDEYVTVRQISKSPTNDVKVEFHVNEQDIMLATAPGESMRLISTLYIICNLSNGGARGRGL